MKRRCFLGVLGASSVALGVGRGKPQKPKYIFYMIGDGMGVAQREAADRYARMKYPARKGGLAMNQLPAKALTSTTEISGKVTDSAAAGTALATGSKTVNGAICLGADLQTPLRSMAYDAMDAGMKVGIVTSVPIDHATPASFYATVPKRSMYYEIDEDLAQSNIDYFAGEPMLGRGKSKGKVPPEQLAKDAGYQPVSDRSAFDALKPGCGKVLVEHSLGYAIEGKQEISLNDYVRKGIELLDGPKGFFMMVEGGKIDWSGHANDLASNIHETLAFDEAVKTALEFCEKHPKESLLVVTADHETGGLLLNEGPPPQDMASVIDVQKFQSAHYANEIKKWKRGGSVATDAAYNRMVEVFGFTALTEESGARIREAVEAVFSDDAKDPRSLAVQKMYGKKNAAVVSCLHELASRAGAQWSSFGHTDTRVATTSYGGWAERFSGDNDNTDLGSTLRQLLGSF
ncbi:alkaline phosphatase [Pontiella sulfatireligans]|uniref:Alkaline phosphatase 3 n=1 Tax=Pontiella sulfatireligans TaxID=2750658 RepID=A0A6C2UIQ7_9BACT|nr:alkaline phosphatase [Pontiella sulfatireligans]VGO20102.1 Alkaline phosphatase 3 [Pontiella sulfatireligans]